MRLVADVADVSAGVGHVLVLAIEPSPLVVVIPAISTNVKQLLLAGASQARALQDRAQPHEPLQ